MLSFFPEMDRAIGGGFERDFPRNEMGMPRSFGDALERGIGMQALLLLLIIIVQRIATVQHQTC